MNCEKITFSRQDFMDSEIAIWGLTFLTDFYKQVQLLFKKPKNITQVNYEKQPTTRTNLDACLNEYSG